MESLTSTGLFHGIPQSSPYMKAPQTVIPGHEHKDRRGRRSRKHQRFLLRKAFLQERGLLRKNKSEKRSFSIHDDCGSSGCPQGAEDILSEKLDEINATLGALPPKATMSSVCSPPCDYDSGLSMAGSSPSSRASSPVSWLKPGKCVAVDCEMVGTGPGGRISELARCSVINYRGDVIYDKYIKPELPVMDYRTRWSGITRKHLKNAISFKTAQKEILMLLKGKRVIGHALHNDFRALKYLHPLVQTRDTSEMTLLNHLAGLPPNAQASLKTLAFNILQKRIQVGVKGHSSVEDAQTCMELYKLVEEQVEQDLLSSSQMSDCSNGDEDYTTCNQYMDDQYWPSDLNEDCK
ncbi:apoptosis-enhancing nuclease [Hyla sarda]|uniref:apoptosis-enhancing nuclease n=1 Tax=Hyla sarda TaxID=327740 RepID=UPI0024C2B297|nr:apoptosis-enhancing nuclease [Hyla sarda]